MTRLQIATARTVCIGCPVRRDCLGEAIADDEEWGIWGGYTKPERQRAVALFDPLHIVDDVDDAVPALGSRAVDGVLAAYDAGVLDAMVVVL